MRSYVKTSAFRSLVFTAGFLMAVTSHAQEPPVFDLVGFAGMHGGTSGGAGGDVITVTTGTELQNVLKDKQDDTTPLTIMVEGMINLDNSVGLSKIDVKDVKDVSIIGAPPYGEFDGIGIKIRRASNIIIRNLKVHHVLTGEKDCISIEGPADHIWVDHCELFNEFQGVDKDRYDGLLDAKAEAEYLTYSWNVLHDSWKTVLVGSSEGDVYDRKLTMHHNFFYNCNSRLPLFRASTGHFFNNYFRDIASTTINSRMNSCVRIERNYFENAQNPWVSAYSDVLGGGELIDNILVNSPFVYGDDTHELPGCQPEIPYDYASVLHDAASVPALVQEFAGVGKLLSEPQPGFFLSAVTLGQGQVLKQPDKPYYDSGEVIVMTAVPDEGWEFDEWTGSVSGHENPLNVVMEENKTVTAVFRFVETGILEVQVENAFCSLNGSVETEHEGYTGTGFIDFENETGSDLEIAVGLLAAANCQLVVRYAHGKTDDRQMEVLVDGTVQVAQLDFPPTGSFASWDTVSFSLDLHAGNHLIRFAALTGNGGPNVDLIRITCSEPVLAPGFCDGPLTGVSELAGDDEEAGWRIIPNPVSGMAYLGCSRPLPGRIMVTVFDLSGKQTQVFTESVMPGLSEIQIELDVDSFEPGMYFVRIGRAGGVQTLRLVVMP